MRNKVVVFDLDDTLYKEIDYLKSAYKEIADINGIPDAFAFMLSCYRNGRNAFEETIRKFHLNTTVDEMLCLYRQHRPAIFLGQGVKACLQELSDHQFVLGLITDGRSCQQRNKIQALGLEQYIHNADILISEECGHSKPSEELYLYFMRRYPNGYYSYVGDNICKDFITPNQLGWKTFCLRDNGENIHMQDFTSPSQFQPQVVVDSLADMFAFLDN